ncbi:MAG: type II toxin-antitoxin system Phd/YefM family antitoxin [Caldilinea sp. CFX5]|nr:type II toxin-antitoxin system Phd/YefM family antitoxin [Caldilinea sp. CFX5]
MRHIPQMASISVLKNDHLKVLAQAAQEPVVLASRNQPVGVLLSPQHWEKLLNRMEDLEDMVEVLNALLREARGEIAPEEVKAEELSEWAQYAQRLPA